MNLERIKYIKRKKYVILDTSIKDNILSTIRESNLNVLKKNECKMKKLLQRNTKKNLKLVNDLMV